MSARAKGRLGCWVFVLLWAVLPVIPAESGGEGRTRLKREEKELIVWTRPTTSAEWVQIAKYVTDPRLRPYFHPLRDASGEQVLTDDRPADHPWQHGVFTGFHRVNGFNYWKEDEGQQRFIRLRNVKDEEDRAGWTAEVELVDPSGTVVLEEENRIVVHAPRSNGNYRIEFELVLRAKERDVEFGKFFVGGLSVRMPWDQENPRQTHLNSEGVRGRAAEQKRAAWCTVERPFGDEIHGFAILDHPGNANHPPAWRVDEQGLINPNVSGLGDWKLAAGEERKFRYEILVYRGAATVEMLNAEFDRFSKSW